MPLLAQEFRDAIREYPVVFAGTEDQIMPAVLLGFGEHENLYVDEAGQWNAKYIPAFARRYPYVFSTADEGKTLTLCIDEEFNGFNQDGEGERLFTDEGEQTTYLKGVLDFQTDFQRFFQRTRTFCQRLQELELLEPMQAQLKFGSGAEKTITGFLAVKRDRLKDLSGEQLSELAVVDELELIYLHLQSMQNVKELAGRIKQDPGGSQASDADTSGEPVTTEAGEDDPAASAKTTKKKKSTTSKKKAAAKKHNGKGNEKTGKET